MNRPLVVVFSLAGSITMHTGAGLAQTCSNCSATCSNITIQRWFGQSGCTSPCAPQGYCPQCNNGTGFAAFVALHECVSRVNVFSESGTGSAGPISLTGTGGSVPASL